MRTIFIFTVLMFCAISVFPQQTKTYYGLKTGMNLSFFSASINSEPSNKTGFHFGGYIKARTSSKQYFRAELYFSSQGQKDNYIIPPNGPQRGSTTTTFNYLNAPLLMEFGEKVSFQGGLQVGFLLSAHEKGIIDNSKIDADLKEDMRSPDFSLVLGMGINPNERFNLGVRFNLGLTDVFKADEQEPNASFDFPDIKNRVIHFYLGYSF